MLKALLRKQFLEMTSFIYGGRSGGKRSTPKILLYLLLLIYAMGSIGSMVYMMMSSICGPLVSAGYGWLYFSIAGILALILGVFGSVFAAKSQIYDAKDNELLLAMPVKPGLLLFARMLGIYFLSLIFEAFILVPSQLVYLKMDGIDHISSAITFIPLLLLFPLITMVFTCLLGWLVAIIASHLKNKSLATVVLSVGFLAVYFYFYSKMQSYLAYILGNVGEVSDAVKKTMYPLYIFGYASGGDFSALLIFALISIGLFGIIYALLIRGFTKIALSSSGVSQSEPVSSKTYVFKSSTSDGALLRKEFGHYLASPVYIMNCSLGTLMFIVAAVALIIKRGAVTDILAQFGNGAYPVTLILGAGICALVSMNNLTAPSISLEGKTLWQVKSLPVPAVRLFRSKVNMHLILTLPPMLIFEAVVFYVIKIEAAASVALILATAAYTLMCAFFGLFVNLKLPSLDWKNETVAVKQSPAVIISMFGGWTLIFAAFGIYMLLGEILGEIGTLLVCTGVFIGISAILIAYLKRNGERILLSL